MSYELSIWDHKDNFIHLLKGEYSFEGSAFKTTFVDRVNGNSELSFSIPMYISDKAIVGMDLPAFLIEESGDLTVSNEDSSKAIFSINDLNSNLRHSIENPPLNEKYRIDEEGYVQASFIDDVSLKINPLWLYVKNEYKIRLVRFKGTDKEKIYDFVIKNFSESRTYDSRTIDVQCKNYAIHELSRLGYSLTINEETPIKNPPPDGKLNIQYWMEIILPHTKNQYSLSNPSGWTFELEGGTLKDIMIPGYDKDGDLYTPRSEIIKEKERIMKIERSNVFNIIQELCEKFEVWANFEYEYDSYGKIIGRKIIFKSEVESNAEYSITYGINAGDMSKESNSDELSTKIIVENVESDLENSGVMSFSECPQNLMMENFIYNFDYYQQAGFISEEKNNWVKTDLAYSIRNKNVIIKEKQSQLAKIKNDYESVAADLEFVTYELAGSQESLQDAQSKSSQYSTATISNTTITYQTVNRGTYSYINLNSRRGVLTSPAPVVRTTTGSIVSISLIEYDANNPKYIVGLRVPTSAPDLVRVTLSYNSYNYYQDLVKIEQNKQVSLNLKKSKLSSLANNLQNQILLIENEIKTVLDEKQLIIDDFENEFYSIIKEGSWKDDGYRLRVEENSISNFLITQTVVNEPTNSYIITTDLNNIDFSTVQCFKTDRSFTYYDKADFTINYGLSGSTRVLLICPTEDGAFALERLQSGGSTLFSNNSQILVNYKTLSNELKTETINRSTTARKVNREYIINAPNVLSSTIKIFPVNGDDALLSPEDYTTSVEYDTVKITLNTTEAAKHIANYYKLEYETNITSQFFYNDAISVAERSAFPEVSYSIAAVDISEIEGFEGFTPKTGQKILINDRELWLVNQYGFLSEISYDLDNPAGTQLTISNYKTRFEDLFQRIVAATQQITLKGESLDRVLNAIPPSGIIVPGILQKSIDENGVLLRNSINNEVTWGAEGITLTDRSETDKTPGQVRIVGGGIFLSDSIDSSGNRIWRTGITPKGFNASEITTGSLNTGRITIWDESNPRFMWNSEGLYAYATAANFTTDFNKFIKFNSDGIVSYSNYSTGVKTFEIKSDGSAYFSGDILVGGGIIKTVDGPNRLEIISTGVNGYVNDILRVQLEYDRIEFHRSGSTIGNIRSEYINEYWHGGIIGDALFIESAGNYIAFNAASGTTSPSMLVGPTWVEIPSLQTATVGVGSGTHPNWYIFTSGTGDNVFEIEHYLGAKLSFDSSGSLKASGYIYEQGQKLQDRYSLYGHNHVWSNIVSGIPATASRWPTWDEVTGKAATATRWPTWSEVTGKPSTFTPSAHSHDYLPLSGGTLTGQLNMGSNNIVGSTSNCWITARRIGLGVAANDTYTVDAGTTGHMRCNRIYLGGTTSGRIGDGVGSLNFNTAGGLTFYLHMSPNAYNEFSLYPTANNKGDIGLSSSSNYFYRGYAGSWNSVSTFDFKTEVALADTSEYYELAKLMNVYSYRTDADKANLQIGLLAEEAPFEVVGVDRTTTDGKAVDIYAFTAFCFGVIKELQQKIDALELKIGGV